MTKEQLFKGWDEAANSTDPYDSDNHGATPKAPVETADKKMDMPRTPGQ